MKKVTFLHENKRKMSGGYTDMTTEERADYGRAKRESYQVRDKKMLEDLKKRKMVCNNDFELVMGYYPLKANNSSIRTTPNEIPRTSGGTLNGKAYK
jgi:hypothetical protein